VAKESLAYVSENYRIEARVIRNRRAHLQAELPQRTVDTRYSYQPSEREGAALNSLYDYIDAYLSAFPEQVLSAEYCRVLLYAASSSPYALLDVLETRLAHLTTPQNASATPSINLAVPAPPRQEAQRIQTLVEHVPVFDGEKEQYLDTLHYQVEQWWQEEEQELQRVAKQHVSSETTSSYRLVQVMNALSEAMMNNSTKKLLVFSGWLQTVEALSIYLETRYGRGTFALFTSDQDDEQLQTNADAFQSDARCRILLCDELGGEGRNFQIADQIIHVDLPWTPGQVEQRIGRVDRLGRKGVVLSLVPFAQGWPEEALFNIWQDAFQLFTHSMSGLEIALEGIQDELVESLRHSSRNGLAELVAPMHTRAQRLREVVEEERYYESAAINTVQRQEFEDISDKYRDGSLLREACSWWASLAGLHQDYDKRTQIVTFSPKMFSAASMKKAQFAQLPNMEEALRRSRRQHTLVVRGTFNRDIAVQREDLIFFAPGSDPWTDAIIANAVESDRGQCCAILRSVPELRGTWRGFELLYTLHVNSRPLYAEGFDPTLLFRALGFLRSSTIRLLISEQGVREGVGSIAWKHTHNRADKLKDIHLGKRDGSSQQIQTFKEQHLVDSWTMQLEQVLAQAQMQLNEELDDYMDELAEEATATFERQVLGLQAASLWQRHYTGEPSLTSEQEIAAYQCVSNALVEGIRHPLRQLESVCYWVLQGA
ncbi:MAG: helicase-related protein, partial [Ktedonobacteraceae bacterium]